MVTRNNPQTLLSVVQWRTTSSNLIIPRPRTAQLWQCDTCRTSKPVLTSLSLARWTFGKVGKLESAFFCPFLIEDEQNLHYSDMATANGN